MKPFNSLVAALTFTGISIGTVCCPKLAQAEQWSAGLGLFQQASEYKGSDNNSIVLPLFFYQGENWAVNGLNIEYSMALSQSAYVYAIVKPRLQGYEQDLSDTTKGMATREHSIDGGLGTGFITDLGLLNFEYSHDLLNEHQGQEFALSYSMPIELSRWEITPTLYARYLSDELVDYYYGVRQSEATLTRAAYQGKAANNIGVNLEVAYYLTKQWRLGLEFNAEKLDDNISDSPLIDKTSNTTTGLTLLYHF